MLGTSDNESEASSSSLSDFLFVPALLSGRGLFDCFMGALDAVGSGAGSAWPLVTGAAFASAANLSKRSWMSALMASLKTDQMCWN